MSTDFNTYRASDFYQGFLRDLLTESSKRVSEFQSALNDAEQTRKVEAAIAVRAKFGKTATANALGISRVTLDKWLAEVETEPEQMARVLEHEAFVQREMVKT